MKTEWPDAAGFCGKVETTPKGIRYTSATDVTLVFRVFGFAVRVRATLLQGREVCSIRQHGDSSDKEQLTALHLPNPAAPQEAEQSLARPNESIGMRCSDVSDPSTNHLPPRVAEESGTCTRQ